MNARSLVVFAAVLVCAPARAADEDVRLPLDAPDARWERAKPVADGAAGGAAKFDDPAARIDAGPCPVSSGAPFTLRASLRTREAGLATPLMARDGEAVGLSLVLGREPGRVSFEAWSWRTVRLVSRTRIDDGKWHQVEVPYDPATGLALLFVDGRLEGSSALGPGGAPTARLRLGNNIGWHQPYRGDVDEVSVVRRTTHAGAFPLLAPVVPEAGREAQLAALRARGFRRSTPSFDDASRWPARRDEVRRAVADALGLDPLPPRGPSDPRVHGEFAGEGFRVQRVSWDSWPGRRATGWLWLPDPKPAGRLPAMLGPHGHWADGAIDPVEQSRAIRFARAGYVSLVVDSVHVEDAAAGVSSLGVMTWNNVRALDVLAARDDVDPSRIGVTGASGGAQQAMVLMALDDRIAAAAPIVMACYYAEIVADRVAHCGCNHVPRMAFVTDVPEICGVFAPRPAFYGSVTGDWTHAFPREGFPELRRLYAALGRADAVANVHRDEGHNYDRPFRELVYAFFDRRFDVAGAFGEATIRPLPVAALRALGAPAPVPDRAALAREHVARRPRFAALRVAAPALPWTSARAPVDGRGARAEWRAATVTAPDGIEVPLLVRDATPAAEDATDGPWTLVVAEEGKGAFLLDPPAWLAKLARVALVDPRFRGEWRAFADAWRRNGILLGRGEGYEAAHDVALAAESLPGAGRVTVVGLGDAGVEALLAAHVSPRIAAVVAPALGRRFAADGNRLPLCPEILRFGDLPEVVRALTGPRRVVLGGAAGPEDWRGGDGVVVTASPAPLGPQEVERALLGR